MQTHSEREIKITIAQQVAQVPVSVCNTTALFYIQCFYKSVYSSKGLVCLSPSSN